MSDDNIIFRVYGFLTEKDEGNDVDGIIPFLEENPNIPVEPNVYWTDNEFYVEIEEPDWIIEILRKAANIERGEDNIVLTEDSVLFYLHQDDDEYGVINYMKAQGLIPENATSVEITTGEWAEYAILAQLELRED